MKASKQWLENVAWLCVFFMLTACGSARIARQAQSEVPTLSPEEQRKYEYFFLEATNLMAKEQYAAAFDLYKHCLDINPKASSALHGIGKLYLHLGQTKQAQDAMEKAVANDPDNYWYQEALATFYQGQRKSDDAIRVYEQIADRYPNYRTDALANLYELYGRKNAYDNSLHTLNRLEIQLGKSEYITMEKYRIYLSKRDMEKAYAELEELVKEYPLNLRYRVILADTYLQNDRTDEAYTILEKVLSEDPNNAMATLSFANYYDKTGQKELYEAQIDRVLANKEISTDIKFNMLQYLIHRVEAEKKDSTYLVARFNSVMEQDAESTNIALLYVQYLLSKDMQKEAVPVLEHILQLEPEHTASRFALLNTAIKENNADKVIKIAAPGVELHPDVMEFYYYLGMAYYQKEEYVKALDTYKSALEHVPADTPLELKSDFYNIMGDLYHSLGKVDEMYLAYDSALICNPENISTLNNYAYHLSTRSKDLDKALEMSFKTIKAEPKNGTYLDTYAWILFMKKRYSEAKIYIDDALKSGAAEDDTVLEHAGDIYYMNGDLSNALYYWQLSQDKGNGSQVLKDKIRRRRYIPDEKK